MFGCIASKKVVFILLRFQEKKFSLGAGGGEGGKCDCLVAIYELGTGTKDLKRRQE